MTQFLGEYAVKIDTKGRFMLPSGLKKQVPEKAENTFVINRGFEKCLSLYPKNEWDTIAGKLNKLNQYVKKNRDFIRYFFRGATEVTLDGTSRLLLPKQLIDYANIQKEMVLFGYTNKIEIWAKELYNNMLTDEPEEFSQLAESVMGEMDEKEVDNE